MIKLLDILEEGALSLTPEERQQVEKMIPSIIDNIKKPLLPNDKLYNIGTIKYKFADGEDGEAIVAVGYPGSDKAKGIFYTQDPKNRTDNWIVISHTYFQQYFPSNDFDQKLYQTFSGTTNTGIERLRQVFKHELIHAKDPSLNHHYLKEPYSSDDPSVYYKSWAEFQTFTGQFFESLISGTDRVLDNASNANDIKGIESALANILQFFAGKTKSMSIKTAEFIDGTGSRNIFQKLFNFIDSIVGNLPQSSDFALHEYVAYLNLIKQYNPEGYKEFLKDLYKTIKSIEEKVNSVSATKIKVQEMKKFSNNPYHLTSIYKDVINEINNNAIPQTIILLENNLINNIQSNDYFTIEERQAIALYLEYYNKFTEENINDFSSGLLNEGLKDWIGSAWSKIKNVFGNIKDFVAKVWKSIKDFVIEQSRKAYNWAKGKLNKFVPEIKKQIIAIKDKAQLAIEATHITKIYDWYKPFTNAIFDNLGKKAEEKAITEIKEVIFNSTFTRLLVEETESVPTDITKPETMSWWKKIGIAIKPFLETLAVIFNPIKFALVQIFKELGPLFLNKLSEFIAKLGGPAAIKYVVLPGIFVEIAELAGAFQGADDLIKISLNLIPGIGSALDTIMEVGHFVFIALACYEILHEILHGLQVDKAGKAIA